MCGRASRVQTDRLLRDRRRRAMKEHELAEEIEKFRKSSKGKPSN
jgi:hypothetical protein